MNWDDIDTVDELPAPPRKDIAPADLELLVLAARALGAVRTEEVDGEGYLNLHFADGSTVFAWNPLIHSDDAFNLAVDLWLAIDAMSEDAISLAYIKGRNQARDLGRDDARAATRRAVTRAAAEIGQQRS